ncbi:hypothetical protein M3C13_011610, partial [Micrococcus luteus]|nr:hypothetical protein [Micrococcus luteus]
HLLVDSDDRCTTRWRELNHRAVHVRPRELGCALFEVAINPRCEEVLDEMFTERLFAARKLEIAHVNAEA